MKTYKKYSEDFKEQALVKVYNRNNDQTIEMVANELNIRDVATAESQQSEQGDDNYALYTTPVRQAEFIRQVRTG